MRGFGDAREVFKRGWEGWEVVCYFLYVLAGIFVFFERFTSLLYTYS